VIKVCNLSPQNSHYSDKYTTFAQLFSEKHKKRLDNPLTRWYTVYVDWVKGKELYRVLLYVVWHHKNYRV